MERMLKKIVRFLVVEDGPTAVEYAMVMLLIVLACLSVIVALGQTTATSMQNSQDSIKGAIEGVS
jgi:pilus assembly protein Flp/PilA